ncbi:MAG: hypothetical protein FWE59_02705 [Oscillospiraceae bacterium]|nr:hypothetical protein [Oscillospiraceae bacterium]
MVWQEKLHAHMSAIWIDLERKLSVAETKRIHIPVRLFKQSVKLTHQMEVQETLVGIEPLNVVKKRDVALELLKQFCPAVENLET